MSPEVIALVGIAVTLFLGLCTLFVGLWKMNYNLRTDIGGKIDELRTEIHGDISGLRGELNALRTETDRKLDGLRGEFNALHMEVDGKLEGLRTEFNALRGEFDILRADVHRDIQKFHDGQEALNRRMARIEGLVDGLRGAINAQPAAA